MQILPFFCCISEVIAKKGSNLIRLSKITISGIQQKRLSLVS